MFRASRFIATAAIAVAGTVAGTVAGAAAPEYEVAAAPMTREPVIFVHGFSGSADDWADMTADFRNHGYPASDLVTFTYDTTQSNVATAERLAAEIDAVRSATGAAKVDLVTHSMGALPSRYYLKHLGGTSVVDDWVSVAGPNHGTTTAYLCGLLAACAQMSPGSEFLAELNAEDETPGPVSYGTWWSACDDIINPDSTVPLAGATNTETGCLGHSELLADDTVAAALRAFIA